MNGRADMLARIRRGLRREAPADRAACEARLATPRPNLVPERGRGAATGLVAQFIAMAEAASCTIALVRSSAAVPDAVAAFLAQHNLPSSLVMAPDADLAALPWSAHPLLARRSGPAVDADVTSLTVAFAGVAETGTLLFASGAAAPSTLLFLPENHIAVVAAAAVVGAYEDAIVRLRARYRDPLGHIALPRTINLVTGPSRTGDIALKIELGAHGPRRVHVIVLDGRGLAAGDAPQ